MVLKHFHINEFDSPDKKGSGEEMRSSTLRMLDLARSYANIPFIINSGYRTEAHNELVGGTPNSSHLRGYAVDVQCVSSKDRFKIIDAAFSAGFTRIGVGNTFIHLDNDPFKKNNVIWVYK